MTDVLVPFEQEGTTAVVRAWLRRVGDAVAEHEPLVELETDKVTQEVPAPAAGVLLEILLDTDAEARPGMVLGRLGAPARPTPEPPPAEAGTAAPAGAQAPPPPTEAAPMEAAPMGAAPTGAAPTEAAPSEAAHAGAAHAEPTRTDAPPPEAPGAAPPDTAATASQSAPEAPPEPAPEAASSGEAPPRPLPAPPGAPPPQAPPPAGNAPAAPSLRPDEPAWVTAPRGALSPAVRRAAAEHGIDPAAIAGTGRGGRVTRADVDQAVAAETGDARPDGAPARPTAPSTPPAEPPADAPPAPAGDDPHAAAPPATGGVRVVPHDRMRLAIARNMLHSVTTAPHVTAVFECDLSAVTAHRRRHKPAFEAAGATLTLTAYLVAACVQAMRAAPAINARWFEDRLEIPDDVGVGVGTALEDGGLVVPVVARAGELSLLGIAARLTALAARARAGTLSPSDMRGGTVTISNHGVSGSLLATPIIINQPQSAILGVGKVEKRVVVREVDGADAIQIRPMAYVSLTIDHRVVDGAATNAWLSRFVAVLEGWPLEG